MIGSDRSGKGARRAFGDVTAATPAPLSAFVGLLVWLLIGLFAIMSLLCAVAAAEVYRGAVAKADLNAGLRTAVSYVAGKVRAWDMQGGVEIAPGPRGDMLLLRETIDDEEYLTRIYTLDDGVYELFTSAEAEFVPEDGQRIAPGENMELSLPEPDLLRIRITVGGEERTTHAALRSGVRDTLGG